MMPGPFCFSYFQGSALMSRVLRFSLGVLPSLLVLLATLPGCNSEEERGVRRRSRNDEPDKPPEKLAVKDYGTISGRVILEDGYKPPPVGAVDMGQNRAECHTDVPRDNLLSALK